MLCFDGPPPWRFPFPAENCSLKESMIGELCDCVFPSLFGVTDFCDEGPYEYKKCRLTAGDTVFDLGANVGLFASVAASKGCAVHAFEASPQALPLLRRGLALYPEVTIVPAAVFSQTGELDFYINADLSLCQSVTRDSIFSVPNYSTERVKVPALTLDDYVKKNKIEKLDFIKADIEGAERDMLLGAREVLATLAPKLALCTYHLPDDPEVLERLILQANPNYHIEHRWKKLFAHVPAAD